MSPAVWSEFLKRNGLRIERFGLEIGVGSDELSWDNPASFETTLVGRGLSWDGPVACVTSKLDWGGSGIGVSIRVTTLSMKYGIGEGSRTKTIFSLSICTVSLRQILVVGSLRVTICGLGMLCTTKGPSNLCCSFCPCPFGSIDKST